MLAIFSASPLLVISSELLLLLTSKITSLLILHFFSSQLPMNFFTQVHTSEIVGCFIHSVTVTLYKKIEKKIERDLFYFGRYFAYLLIIKLIPILNRFFCVESCLLWSENRKINRLCFLFAVLNVSALCFIFNVCNFQVLSWFFFALKLIDSAHR